MSCSHCQGIESLFDQKTAAKELKRYRKAGVKKVTKVLIAALKGKEIKGMTLLDVGGGIGEIQHELLQAGVTQATNVEGASAYLAATKEEAERRGHAEQINLRHGDFIELAPKIPPADIVTLDRVICCYPDVDALVSHSVAKSRWLVGVIYPRELWWIKLYFGLQNLFIKLNKNSFRMFVHSTGKVESLILQQGFKRTFFDKTFLWQIVIYEYNKTSSSD